MILNLMKDMTYVTIQMGFIWSIYTKSEGRKLTNLLCELCQTSRQSENRQLNCLDLLQEIFSCSPIP